MNLVRITSFCVLLFSFGSGAFSQLTYRQDSTLTERFVSGKWQDFSLATYTHNGGDKFSHWLMEHIDANGKRTNFQQATFTHHEITRLIELKESQYWSEATNTWINSQRFEYSYTNEKLDVINLSGWLQDDKVWQLFSIDSFFYDGNGDCIKFLNYTLRQGSFVLSNTADYVYGSAGLLDSTKYATLINGSLYPIYKLSYHRDAAGRDTAIYRNHFNATDGSYSPSEITRFIRNADGDCIRMEALTFNPNTQEWGLTGMYTCEVNGLVKKEHVLFDTESFPYITFENTLTQWTLSKSLNGTLNKETRTTYYFDKALPNSVIKTELPGKLLYPNPCTSKLHVDLTKMPEAARLAIYDMQGRNMHLQFFEQDAQVNVVELAPGLYMLHILDANGRGLGNAKFLKE